MKYLFCLTVNPSFAILSSEDQFVHVEQRIGKISNDLKDIAIKHIEFLDDYKKTNHLRGYLQLRRLFFDDKSGSYQCVIDYLSDEYFEEKPDFNLGEEPIWIIEGQPTYYDLKIISCSSSSDHFDKNHREYYQNNRVIPWMSDFDLYMLKRKLDELKDGL